MARMYSRRKGKSGSKRPIKKGGRSWVRYRSKEIELLIMKLAKEGKTPSQIGLYLRDTYGIPSIKEVTKQPITQILKEKNLLSELPEDLTSLIRKAVLIRKHLENNPADEDARRGIIITESKIKKLVKYYKTTGKLPSAWKYDPTKVRLIVE